MTEKKVTVRVKTGKHNFQGTGKSVTRKKAGESHEVPESRAKALVKSMPDRLEIVTSAMVEAQNADAEALTEINQADAAEVLKVMKDAKETCDLLEERVKELEAENAGLSDDKVALSKLIEEEQKTSKGLTDKLAEEQKAYKELEADFNKLDVAHKALQAKQPAATTPPAGKQAAQGAAKA